VTAIQGASGRTRSTEEALVRNVDLRIFGQHRDRAMIDLPSPSSRDAEKLREIVAEIGRGEVDALHLHLAEGQADNQRSQNEFGRLVEDCQGLTPATALIHGTALTRQQLGQGQGRRRQAGLVPAEQPAAVRPDHPRRRRAAAGDPGRAGRRLAAQRQHQPAG
jgi:hypothetical protein